MSKWDFLNTNNRKKGVMSKGNIPHAILLSLGVFFFFTCIKIFVPSSKLYNFWNTEKHTKKNKILDYSQFAAFFSTQTEHS